MKKKVDPKKDDKIVYAWLATFLSLIGFFIALIVKRKDSYVMYYAKQSLVIFLIGVVAGAIGQIFSIIPFMGGLINFALGALTFVIWALSWVFALSGKEKEIPIISSWAEKINL